MTTNTSLGKTGEELAVRCLQEHGYTIVEQNFRNKLGEIDIIAKDTDTICFVEVKTRRSTYKGTPFEVITKAKQMKLVKVAVSYLKNKKLFDCPARFDIVGITSPGQGPKTIELIQNAIDLSDMKYR